jgi:hypothetical protein
MPNLCVCIGGVGGGVAGHIVHSCVCGPLNVDAIFVMLGWDRYEIYKKRVGHVKPNLCFCIRWDVCVT